jgi:hypothetical protein
VRKIVKLALPPLSGRAGSEADPDRVAESQPPELLAAA